MSKKPNILSVLAGFLSSRTINENFTRIADAFDNTLSRDGSLPNHMNADFDMNSNDILNVNRVSTKELEIEGEDSTLIKNWAKEAERWSDLAHNSSEVSEEWAGVSEGAAELAVSAAGSGATMFSTREAVKLAVVPPFFTHLQTAGYSVAGDGGGALYSRVEEEPEHEGKVQSKDGSWWELSEEQPTPRHFGAKGDIEAMWGTAFLNGNSFSSTAIYFDDSYIGKRVQIANAGTDGKTLDSTIISTEGGLAIIEPPAVASVENVDAIVATDDADAFLALIDYCYKKGRAGYVNRAGLGDYRAGYAISKPLRFNRPIAFECDPSVILRAIGEAASTVLIDIDFGEYQGHRSTFRFGTLQGDDLWMMTGDGVDLPSAYRGKGLRIANCDLARVYYKYISYFDIGLEIAATEQATENIEIEFDVMDDNTIGILWTTLDYSIHVTTIRGNTIGLSQFNISYDLNGGIVDSCKVDLAQLWNEYPNGAAIAVWLANNARVSHCIFEIRNISAQSTPFNKRKHGVDFINPFFAGDTPVLNYGMARFDGCSFEIGVSPSDPIPNQGLRGVHTGYGNRFKILPSQSGNLNNARKISLIKGAENYRSGTREQANKIILYHDVTNNLEAGDTITAYLYHQFITHDDPAPYNVQLHGQDSDMFAITAVNNTTGSGDGSPLLEEIVVKIEALKHIPSGWRVFFAVDIGC